MNTLQILTVENASCQQRCLPWTAVESSMQQVPLELLINLISGNLILQPQGIWRVEFHAEAEQDWLHICNKLALINTYPYTCIVMSIKRELELHLDNYTAYKLQ